MKDKIKLEAKRDLELETITFDLEAALYTPCSKVSTLFYKRKLCTYNLTTFNMANKEGQFYMWDETLAKRRSNEIGSGLIKFCEKNQHAKKLVMISNACGGQTRNQFIAAVCLYLVTKAPNLEVIDHIFMVYGHSNMEVDSMHARIELASDTLNIYVPHERAIVASVARKNPYVVNLFEQSDIKDLKMLKNDMKLTNFKVNTNGEPDKVFYRTNYDETKLFSEILVR